MTGTRVKTQVWVDTEDVVLQEAKRIADEKRMTFGGFIGFAIKEAIEKERTNDKSSA